MKAASWPHLCIKDFPATSQLGFQVPDSLGCLSPSQPLSNKTISQAFYFSWLLVSALKRFKADSKHVHSITSTAGCCSSEEILVHRDMLPHLETRMLSPGERVTLFASI